MFIFLVLTIHEKHISYYKWFGNCVKDGHCVGSTSIYGLKRIIAWDFSRKSYLIVYAPPCKTIVISTHGIVATCLLPKTASLRNKIFPRSRSTLILLRSRPRYNWRSIMSSNIDQNSKTVFLRPSVSTPNQILLTSTVIDDNSNFSRHLTFSTSVTP